MDVCFWLDIAINFRTAYYAGEFGDELVSEWRKIARRYACSWLALDVFASFPFELFSTLFCTSLRSTTCRARDCDGDVACGYAAVRAAAASGGGGAGGGGAAADDAGEESTMSAVT